MKTKEDLLQDLSEHYQWTDIEQQRIEEKMDEYAKEIAVGFAKFIDDDYMTVGFDKYIKSKGDDVDTTFTTEQLFNLYLDHLNSIK